MSYPIGSYAHPVLTFRFLLSIFLVLLLLSTASPTLGEDDSAAFELSDSITIERPQGAGEARFILAGPYGEQTQLQFAADEALLLNLDSIKALALADGLYTWEARFSPVLTEQAQQAPPSEPTDESRRGLMLRPESISPLSGSFRVLEGRFLPGPSVGESLPKEADPQHEKLERTLETLGEENPSMVLDVVYNDDLIVVGSLCVGFDCVNNEAFSFDTIRMKENNTRLKFQDTSTAAGFPANDWELTANDSASGGVDRFSIRDVTAGRDIFTLRAGAPNHSLYVDSQGRAGLGTSTPMMKLHMTAGDTPAVRLEQTDAGFGDYVWDVAGNEANFFVRDITGGSLLPFRIRPGAPTNSLHIIANGNVGMGLSNSTAALHIQRPETYADAWLLINSGTDDRRLELDNQGNLFVSGAITQLSSRSAKENLLAVGGAELLSQLGQLPIWTWNYLTADQSNRHIGPVAEDFYRVFGLGRDERSLSPSDMAGVALAASQALNQEIEKRDLRIEELETRLERLESLLLGQ